MDSRENTDSRKRSTRDTRDRYVQDTPESMWNSIRRMCSGNCPVYLQGYSLLCGGILMLLIAGIDAVASTPLFSSGNAAVTSGNIRHFFRSWHGYVIVLLTVAILIIASAAFLNWAILLSEALYTGRQVRPARYVIRGFTSIRLFLRREGLPIVLQFVLFVPIFAATLFFLIPDPFEIPGLIRYLIHKKLLYEIVYFAILLLLLVLQMRNLFLYQEVVLQREDISEARRAARRLLKENRTQAWLGLFLSLIAAAAVGLAGAGVFLLLPHLLQKLTAVLPRLTVRCLVLIGTYSGLLIFLLSLLMSPWMLLIPAVDMYHRIRKDREETKALKAGEPPAAGENAGRAGSIGDQSLKEIQSGQEAQSGRGVQTGSRKRVMAVFALVCAGVVAVMSAVSMRNFDSWFPRARKIEAVVHRLGGDLDAENTLEGQEAALEAGALAAETDIQRSRDGEYIIFHDSSLKRLCGSKERPCDLTLEQLREKTILNAQGEPRQIPTLREVLQKAKGREKLYLELKGVTVDEQMADDVIAMVREMGMEDDCVLISMIYPVIRYIHRTYPEVRCGYLSFFTYGSNAKLDGNILLSLSHAISPAKTTALHRAGKRLYCWTVNTRSQARRMIRLNVDGIISDRYDIIQSVLDHQESRTDCERIMDVLRN